MVVQSEAPPATICDREQVPEIFFAAGPILPQVRLTHQSRPVVEENSDYDEYAANVELDLILVDGY